ncbi:MAG: hypothetical protein V4714_20300 [Bacteroidota bacterium]
MKKIIFCLFGFTFLTSAAFAQADEEDDNYNSEFAYGINLNTNGGLIGGFMLKNSRKINGNMYHYFFLEIVNVKHPKEVRYPTYQNSTLTDFKQNFMFVVRPQYGRELVLFRKAPEQGVQINAILAAGPSFGLLKPYYIQYNSGQQGQSLSVSAPYTNQIRNHYRIEGAGSFFDGFDQMSVKLGANLKAAVSFELGTFRNSVTGFEVGILTEAFTQKMVIMDPATVPGQQFFTSAYINIFFGSRK